MLIWYNLPDPLSLMPRDINQTNGSHQQNNNQIRHHRGLSVTLHQNNPTRQLQSHIPATKLSQANLKTFRRFDPATKLSQANLKAFRWFEQQYFLVFVFELQHVALKVGKNKCILKN